MKKGRKKLVLFVFLVGLIFALIVCKFAYQHFIKVNTLQKDDNYIYLFRKSNTQDVINQLFDKQLIADSIGLLDFMIRKNYQRGNIIGGKYKISAGWSNNKLVNHLRAGNGRIETRIVITSSRDLGIVAKKITKELFVDSTLIDHFLRDSMDKYGFDQANKLCMFLPNTYFVDWDATPRELLDRMYKEYTSFWTEERKSKAAAIPMSANEVQTLASIVYWETKLEADMPIVAGVYINRIRQGIPLQADPTLIFALNDYSIRRVLNTHKRIESPYNTYKYNGLPPGPILIPPAKFIDAVLNYAKHDYIFFVAKEDFSGASYFSKTYAEHQQYAELYRKALNDRGVMR